MGYFAVFAGISALLGHRTLLCLMNDLLCLVGNLQTFIGAV